MEYINNLIYTQLRDYLNPIPSEQKKIINNMIVLNELPYYPDRVVLADEDMVEIDIRQSITNINQYKVDYNVATVYFHPDRENQTMNMTYTGKGLILIDGSRVVTLYENGTIKETLNQLAEILRQTNQEMQDNEIARETQFGLMEDAFNNATHYNIITATDWTFTATADNTTEYDLNLPIYNPLIDDVQLIYEGFLLKRGENYTLTGTHIVLGWTLNNGESIDHHVIKGVNYTPQPADASLYPNNSIPKEKLALDAQNTLQSVGNKDNLTTDYKIDLVGAVNEHETQINSNTAQLSDITANKLPLKANQSDLNITNTNVANNASSIALKADKTTIWDMAHMGQDVKTAITGGATAVVGNLGTHANNLASDLLSTIGKFTQATYTIITATYWDGTKNLNQSATSSNYNSIQYSVVPNEVYSITTLIDTSTLAIARFYDVSGNYMSGGTIGYGQTGTYTDYIIVVPSSAVTMTITSKNTLTPVLKKHSLLDLNGFKDGFNYFDIVSVTLQNGFYDNYNAGFVSNSNYKSIYTACVPGDVYNCDTVINTSSLAIVWFWNSSNVKLSSIGLGQQGTYTNYEFTIPNGAAYLSITSANPNLPVLRKKKLSTYASIHSEITTNQTNISNLNKFFYKYSSSGNQLKVFIPYKDKYKLFQFEKGGVNQIFGMGYRYDLTDLDNESDKVQSYNLITDWISPYIVNVASNADGDNKDDVSDPNLAKWTGGWHSYNGVQTGTNSNIASARCVSYEIFVDNKKITLDVTSKLPWVSEIKIVVINRMQSWQTRKLDGTGREVLQETVTYKIRPNGEILVENEIQALEQISITTYFGLQVDTQSTFHKIFYDDDTTRLWKEALNVHTESGNKINSNCKSFVCADDSSNYIKAFVDNTFGLYRHDYLDSTSPLAHSENYNKAYFNAVLASSNYLNLNTSEIAKWKGGWLFYCI